MKIINKEKYLTPNIIEPCFIPGKVTVVDKRICGNGFTTAFLTSKFNGISACVLPNREATLSKQDQDTEGRTVYLHSTGDSYLDLSNSPDNIVSVYDSFIINKGNLLYWLGQGVKMRILIDELHSLQIGSVYRPALKGYTEVLQEFADAGAAVCIVTATPFKYQPVDITIINEEYTPKTIYYSESEAETIKRALALYEAGESVIIFTNNKSIMLKFKNAKTKQLRACFGSGSSLKLSLSEYAILDHDINARLKLYSSRSFEGHDVYGKGWSVFIFENRSHDYTRFSIQQIIQAAARTREGAKYIEYCRVPRKIIGSIVTADQLINFIEREDMTTEKKLNKANFAPFKDFVTPIYTEGYKMDLRFEPGPYLVKGENIEADEKDWRVFYQSYFEDRGITILPAITEKGADLHPSKAPRDKKEEYLRHNRAFIRDNKLLEDYRAAPPWDITFKSSCTAFQKERRRLLFREETTESQRRRIEQVEKFLPADGSRYYFDKILKKMSIAYSKEVKGGCYTDSEIEKKITKFEERVEADVLALLFYVCNEWISIPKKMVAHRDYNALVTLRPSSLRILFDGFGFTITELDIRTCNPRILYAIFGNGEPLPEKFYGENKVNKTAINKELNKIYYNSKKGSDLNDQARNQKARLLKYGISPAVAAGVIDFCYKGESAGDLFNLMAYHERLIIKKLRTEIKVRDMQIIGCPRRHDSVLIFHEIPIDFSWVNDFEYENIKGWLSV